MHFPIADVIKNVKYFMTVVKRATGNIRDAAASKEKGGPKPCKSYMPILRLVLNQITISRPYHKSGA